MDLFYEDIGIGEPVLFLHSHYNRGILAFACQLQALNKYYRCILPDCRGHGRTRSNSLLWNAGMIAQDMICFLDSQSLRRVHIIGYSMGGGVGFHLANTYPQYIASLISIGCNGFPFAQNSYDYLPENLIKNKNHDFIELMKSRHFDAHRGNWEEFLRQSAADNDNYPSLSQEQLSAISAPVLIIAGENDPLLKKEETEIAKAVIPDCEFFITENGGHGPHMLGEHTMAVNQSILHFLKHHQMNL